MPKKSTKKAAKSAEDKNEKAEVAKLSQEEYEKKVLELSEQGLTSEKIGEALRHQGIHPKEFNKKISQILGSKYSNPDEKNIQIKFEKISKHFATNKGDRRAMRDKEKTLAKLNRLKMYLVR